MPFPMPHHNAFAAHAPAVPSCQAGPHLAAPKTHQPQLHMSLGSPERGRKDRPVILSAAKDLVAHRARPFAAPRVAIGGSRQTLRDAQGDTVRSLSLMRIGPHLAGPYSNRKLISSTFIAYHFDKDLIRIFIIIPLQSRAHEQQIFNCRRHTFERTTPVYFRNWNGKLKFASLCNEMYNLLRQMQT